MGSGHLHGPDAPATRRTRTLLAALLVPFVVVTAVGLVLLWPSQVDHSLSAELGAPDDLVDARVVGVERGPCTGTPAEAGITCTRPSVRLLEGPDAGTNLTLQEQSDAGGVARLEPGDEVVLGYFAGAPEGFRYSFADRQRRDVLYVLGGMFALAVVGLGRWKGLRALLGLATSLVVLTVFILPAVLDGSPPLAVALVGSAAIALTALYLAHGLTARTTTAVLGTLASLAIVGVLAALFVAAAELTGLADEEATFLRVSAAQVDLQGLLLGGIVIGALGVLDDVTVTQVSAVWELRKANPGYSRVQLYRSALGIGRDHIASTVNTLVLAYAGASLPLFLLFTQADQGLLDVANGESVAVEIVRTLVGSIGLVASVPITTALAALVSSEDGRGARATVPAGREPAESGPTEPQDRPRRRWRGQARRGDPRAFRSRGERAFWRDE